MGYTDLIFDLYGTLVDIHTEENDTVWEKTAFFFGFYGAHYTKDSLKQAFLAALARREAKAGQSYECFPDIPFEQVMAELFEAKDIRENAAALGVQAAQLFRIASLEYIRLYPGTLEALAYLRQKGLRLWLLSNAQQVFTAYELRLLGLGEQLDGICLSSDYGCRKPDVRFYRALLQEQGLSPENCLMIGNDRHTDIAGAKAAGLATVYMHTGLTPADQAAADLSLSPENAPLGCRHFEFEGSDWQTLAPMLARIAGTAENRKDQNNMHIETERLTITEFSMDMAQAVHENSLDEDNRRFSPDEVFETLEEAAETLEFLMGVYESGDGPLVYPVLEKDGTYVGYVQAVPLEEGQWEVGYHIGGRYAGKGYATEAVKAFLPVILPKLGISRIAGICVAENKASIRVMERCGFQKEYEGEGPYQGQQRQICRFFYTPEG